jgi:3-ketosteroid 9alpha-monooxygenase subunit A
MTPYPRGWYFLEYSSELAKGATKTLRYFGRELLLARMASGRVLLSDPFCPHLGAHLGHGGKVRGEALVCPFHAWEFGVDGRCTRIPYDTRIPHKAKLDAWHVREQDGAIYGWFDRAGGAPDHEPPPLPVAGDPEWSGFIRKKRWEVRTHIQEVTENGLDGAHFETVHKLGLPTRSESSASNEIPFRMRQEYEAPYFGLSARLLIELHEPGVHHTRAVLGSGEAFILSTLTPVDEDAIVHRFSILVKKSVSLPVRLLVSNFLIREVGRQYEQDIPIWENKKYLDRPVLCSNDGEIHKIREWFRMFD